MNYTIKELKIVLMYLLIMIITIILCSLSNNYEQKNKVKAFNNNKTLLCFDTLIVTNSNWKLSEDNLINNNSAGYVKIKDCKVKYEN